MLKPYASIDAKIEGPLLQKVGDFLFLLYSFNIFYLNSFINIFLIKYF